MWVSIRWNEHATTTKICVNFYKVKYSLCFSEYKHLIEYEPKMLRYKAFLIKGVGVQRKAI